MTKEWLDQAARAVDQKLPDNYGFMLFVVPFGDNEKTRISYVSSLSRDSAIEALKEWIEKKSASKDSDNL